MSIVARAPKILLACLLAAIRIPVAFTILLLAYGAAHLPLFVAAWLGFLGIYGSDPVHYIIAGSLTLVELLGPLRRLVRNILVFGLVRMLLLVLGVHIVEKRADVVRHSC